MWHRIKPPLWLWTNGLICTSGKVTWRCCSRSRNARRRVLGRMRGRKVSGLDAQGDGFGGWWRFSCLWRLRWCPGRVTGLIRLWGTTWCSCPCSWLSPWTSSWPPRTPPVVPHTKTPQTSDPKQSNQYAHTYWETFQKSSSFVTDAHRQMIAFWSLLEWVGLVGHSNSCWGISGATWSRWIDVRHSMFLLSLLSGSSWKCSNFGWKMAWIAWGMLFQGCKWCKGTWIESLIVFWRMISLWCWILRKMGSFSCFTCQF